MWEQAREEAYDALQDEVPLMIYGSDIDAQAIEISIASSKKAGLGGEIHFQTAPVAKLRTTGDYGVIVTNPPYGERLGNQKDAETVLRQLGSHVRGLHNWSTYILSPSKNLEHYMEEKADKKRKLYNGRIECQFYQFFGPRNAAEEERWAKRKAE